MNRPNFINFGRTICGHLDPAERREWWLANGLGGYAAGNIAGTLTRRYHGLLIAPVQPPLGRSLVFVKADATLELDGIPYPLFSNRWSDNIIDPSGFVHIESFRLDGRMPVWRYALGDVRLEFRLWLEHGANTVYLAYRPEFPNRQQRQLKLHIRLLVNGRDHHGITEPWGFNPIIEPAAEDRLSVTNHPESASGTYRLQFHARGGNITPDHSWYENFDLLQESERGLPCRDRHLCVGQCQLTLIGCEWHGLTASLENQPSIYLEEAMRRCLAHDDGIITRVQVTHPELQEAPGWIRQLILATDSFLFSRPLGSDGKGESVIAGFPWFGDWGRDTMIALPGLTLATGRYDSARAILNTFSRYLDQGMLPNVFPGTGEQPEYNTVDAALWYIEAWRAYVETTHDWHSLQPVYPALEAIIHWYKQGTRYGIAMDAADGLIRSNADSVQLTWMDAKIGDWVVTPRTGKAVEVNALWYNAIKTMAAFAVKLRYSSDEYRQLAEKIERGFQRFINPATGYLFDVLDGPEGYDGSLRPNQILAVSLPYSPLTPANQNAVVSACGHALLTSHGLRSLASQHPDYCPQYTGDVRERDGAYHQGTVWTWLLGHYALAEHRVYRDIEQALSRLEPIRQHLFDAGLGTVSEIFDGDPPHAPRGAPAQAWSVACVLEAWWRLQREKSRPHLWPTAQASSRESNEQMVID